MAEKPEDQVTMDEKIAKAKELFGRGARNYYVKCYVDAADDLSEACKLYTDAYGVDGDELGEVYLLYAKALIEIGQDENKLIEVPEDEEEDEPVEEDDGETPNDEKAEADAEEESSEKSNGHSDEQKENDEPQPGPSGTNENESSNDAEGGEGEGEGEGKNEENEEEDESNLEVAWEVLQNAALVFQRQEEKGLKNLLEVYNEMARISIENGNFSLAIDDFTRALTTFDLLEDDKKNDRIAAEIHYKIGLCQSMEKAYDESVKSFQKAHDLIAGVIEKEKAKEDQSAEHLASIKDMEETQQEIMNKITEIGEVKADEIEQVKRELTKLYGVMNGTSGSDPGAGCSSSSSALKSPDAEKPKPTDISHLIKRKKPDADTVESSPAKKKIVETSPDKPAAVIQDEKVVEEAATVHVAAVDN